MAAELRLLSLNQLQKLPQSQQTTSQTSWMWNPKAQPQAQAQPLEDEDSWEVRAFAEDTGNVMGTTWPPRSYTCTFCRREFRSAQALGGHMNVHRRDRARLHQTNPGGGGGGATAAVAINPITSSSLFPTQDFTAKGGLCLLYQLPNPNGPIDSSPSTFLSISPSPYPSKDSINFPATYLPEMNNSASFCYSTEPEPSTRTFTEYIGNKESSIEELDLELRLGHTPTTS